MSAPKTRSRRPLIGSFLPNPADVARDLDALVPVMSARPAILGTAPAPRAAYGLRRDARPDDQDTRQIERDIASFTANTAGREPFRP